MKIIMQAYDTTYTAEISDEANLDKVMGRGIAPLLIALGYSDKLINEMFKDGNPINWDTVYE